MSTLLGPRLSELSPELFLEIVEHLPLMFRTSTVLSLALACRRLYDIIFPEILYNSVLLLGEDQAFKTFDVLIERAKVVTEEDIQIRGNPSLSHCIHHLLLCGEIEVPMGQRTSLDALKELIDIDGLRHLESLALHPHTRFDGLKIPFLPSLKLRCPNLKKILIYNISYEHTERWIEPYIFFLEKLTSVQLQCTLERWRDLSVALIDPTLDLLQLPSTNLHTLELRPYHSVWVDASALLRCVIPNLRALILDGVSVSDTIAVNAFWRAHPGIERLEFHGRVWGVWFDDLEDGILPDVKYLMCDFIHALAILPRVSISLITLTVRTTYNAQALYLLRVVCPRGVLPALRGLGVHVDAEKHRTEPCVGARWREDENGQVSLDEESRHIDGNYIMSLAKAAPNVEELELMGTSDDTVDSLTASLSMFRNLSRLMFSAGMNVGFQPFFPRSPNWEEFSDYLNYPRVQEKDYGRYAPATFDDAVRDLANGCRTLDVVTMGSVIGDLYIRVGASRRIVRVCEGGEIRELRKIRPWGNIIGREDDTGGKSLPGQKLTGKHPVKRRFEFCRSHVM